MPATILQNLTAPILNEDLSSLAPTHDDRIRILREIQIFSYCTATGIIILLLIAIAALGYLGYQYFHPAIVEEPIYEGSKSWGCPPSPTETIYTPTHTDAIYPPPLRRPYGPPPSTTRSWDCHPSPTEAIAVQMEYQSPIEAVTIQPDAESWGSGSKTWGSHAE